MKKSLIITVLIAMLIATALLYGCSTGDEVETTVDNVSDNSEVTTEPVVEVSDFIIFDSNEIYFNIVRGTYASDIEVNAAVALNKAFKEAYPGEWKASIKDDFFMGQNKNETYEIEGKEILVGITNRKESHEAHATLEKDQFVIKVSGDKLVIVGYDAYATAGAVEHFINTYLSEKISDKLDLDKNLVITGESSLRKAPVNSEAEYRIMTWNLGCMVSDEKNGEVECVDIILHYLPDIMGLQECNAAVHNKVLNNLPEFYAFANKKHIGSSTVNYTPIIYNTQLFTLVDSNVEWLRGRYTGTNTKSISWAVFEDKNGDKFALINYHGAVCSNSYKGFENFTGAELNQQALTWKLDNVVQVTEIKNSIVTKYGSIPIMVSGDNNFNSSSQPYANIISEGFADAEHTARLGKMTGYRTSYSYGSVPGEGLSIDHVFGLNGVDFVEHYIVRGDDVWKASDHCPVYVDFNIKN